MRDPVELEVHTIGFVFCPKVSKFIPTVVCESCDQTGAIDEALVECYYETEEPQHKG